MQSWIIHVEHSHGGSVGHPCKNGVYEDPTDVISGDTLVASSEDDAEAKAWDWIRSLADHWEGCDCGKVPAGGMDEKWYGSVTITCERVEEGA